IEACGRFGGSIPIGDAACAAVSSHRWRVDEQIESAAPYLSQDFEGFSGLDRSDDADAKRVCDLFCEFQSLVAVKLNSVESAFFCGHRDLIFGRIHEDADEFYGCVDAVRDFLCRPHRDESRALGIEIQSD